MKQFLNVESKVGHQLKVWNEQDEKKPNLDSSAQKRRENSLTAKRGDSNP